MIKKKKIQNLHHSQLEKNYMVKHVIYIDSPYYSGANLYIYFIQNSIQNLWEFSS